MSLAGSTGEACRDVQHPVAERVDLATGQLGGIGEAEELGPGHQICCGHDDFQPGGISLARVKRQVTKAGGEKPGDPMPVGVG